MGNPGTMSLLSFVGIYPQGKHFHELVLVRTRAIMKSLYWEILLSWESRQCFADEIGHNSIVYQSWAQILFKIFTCCYNTWVSLPSFLFFAPRDLQDLSFRTRDGIRCPWQWEGQVPTTGPLGTSWGLL